MLIKRLKRIKILLKKKGHLESVGTIALAPKTKKFFVSGSSDKNIKIWDVDIVFQSLKKKKNVEKNEENSIIKVKNALRTVYSHEKDINCIKISPNEKLIASASQDRLIKVKISHRIIILKN